MEKAETAKLPQTKADVNAVRGHGKIAPHSFQCIFFETGDLGLGDADHVGDLGLGLSFEKAQRDDMTLSVVQTFHGFAEGEMFSPTSLPYFFYH